MVQEEYIGYYVLLFFDLAVALAFLIKMELKERRKRGDSSEDRS